MNMIAQILKNILLTFYENLAFSVILSVFVMFFYLEVKKGGTRSACRKWLSAFRTSAEFRQVFCFVLIVALILHRTLLNREIWGSPLRDVLGTWGLYDSEGNLTTDGIENMMMFVPFSFFLLHAFQEKLVSWGKGPLLWKIMCISFGFSLTIEMTQLMMHLGEFQLSDLFHNTLGGVVGAMLYLLAHSLKQKKANSSPPLKRQEKTHDT